MIHVSILLLATLTAQQRADFVQMVYQQAAELQRLGAPINPAVVAAQAALESRYGDSVLARRYNNIFGIHASRDWKGKTVTFKDIEHLPNGKIRIKYYKFRVYNNIRECLEDYVRIISSSKYYTAAAANNLNPIKYIDGLLPKPGKPGWATDPLYKQKILQIINRHGLV